MYLHCWLRALSDFCQAENLLGEAKDTLIQITNKTSQAICSFQKGLVALKVRLMIVSHNFFLVTCNANLGEKDIAGSCRILEKIASCDSALSYIMVEFPGVNFSKGLMRSAPR